MSFDGAHDCDVIYAFLLKLHWFGFPGTFCLQNMDCVLGAECY
jgi:hypothetical protein